ncbi:MAG TPA: Uma2 family endonuclease [Humisphaera sp.]|nr:Uma2 family endonuclease [Humisphaera sp.]
MVRSTLQSPTPSSPGIVFEGVDWDFYEQVLARLDNRHVFATYDRGRLELMTTSWEHESYADLLASLVRTACRELAMPYKSGGSTTFRRRDLEAGIEPDRCFYIQNQPAIRGKRKLNLSIDPPPDLAIEVEISERLLDRVSIYERLGVPELWRNDGKRSRVMVLGRGGKYRTSQRSAVFPWLSFAEVDRLLETSWDMSDDLAWERTVAALVRRQR